MLFGTEQPSHMKYHGNEMKTESTGIRTKFMHAFVRELNLGVN